MGDLVASYFAEGVAVAIAMFMAVLGYVSITDRKVHRDGAE